MQAEKKVRSYTRRTKSGKTITVKAHTARYEAADKKEATKGKGSGKEIEELMDKKKTPIVEKPETPFTKEEFKEWYEGTGSAADKKVAKVLRKRLGRFGYHKFEDEAIDNYTPRGHSKMFKRVSDGLKGTKTYLKEPVDVARKNVPLQEILKKSKERKMRKKSSMSHSKSKALASPYELASATLRKSGLRLDKLKDPNSMEIYKAGDRKSLKNLIAGITYNGRHISFGGRFEKENKKKYSSVIAKALKEAGYGVEQ